MAHKKWRLLSYSVLLVDSNLIPMQTPTKKEGGSDKCSTTFFEQFGILEVRT